VLEYIGARKILKSQPEEGMSLMLLTHAAEELRHAKALKGLVERLGGRANMGYGADETLCGEQARAYFQSLDDQVSAEVGTEPRDFPAKSTECRTIPPSGKRRGHSSSRTFYVHPQMAFRRSAVRSRSAPPIGSGGLAPPTPPDPRRSSGR
jgi:hypothetical protein